MLPKTILFQIKIKNLLFIFILLGFFFSSCSPVKRLERQDERRAKKLKNEIAHEQKKRDKAYEKIVKRQIKMQSKRTKKEMRENRRKARRFNENKKQSWIGRWWDNIMTKKPKQRQSKRE